MSSRFNTLYLGEPEEAAQVLEDCNARGNTDQHVNELRVSLINALKRIAVLEDMVRNLTEPVR